MGKKKAAAGAGLGRALIRERGQGRARGGAGAGWLHTSELNDGYNWGRLNLQSVTEESSLEEFLATAELAGTEFVAEKLNVRIVPAEAQSGLPTAEEAKKIQELHEQNRHFLQIPRRPCWDRRTSPEMLSQAERDSFLEWRRQLARLEEEQKLILTPFERNLDFWRQLWRVLERSDVVVQIVDARNPLLFRCQDLEHYVKEISPEKENLILLNKADLLSEEQRSAWARFFEEEGVQAVFWSALAEGKRQGVEAGEAPGQGKQPEAPPLQGFWDKLPSGLEDQSDEGESEGESDAYEDCEEGEEEAWVTCSEGEEGNGVSGPLGTSRTEGQQMGPCVFSSSSRLVQRDELLEIFRTLHSGKKIREGGILEEVPAWQLWDQECPALHSQSSPCASSPRGSYPPDDASVPKTCIISKELVVGYPNVGKSSTINTILGKKKVSVSATPGHTKHFQTLYVEPGLCLCDCPGLVMPSFISTKAEMICSGILPIDQMRDHLPPVSLVCQRIPRPVLEATYGIRIVRPREGEPPDRPPTSEELLMAYGYMRGFMTDHGQPDQPRAARYVLKDYVQGKLLYCHPPPGIDPQDFQGQHQLSAANKTAQCSSEMQTVKNPKTKQMENMVDVAFFHQENIRVLTRGSQPAVGYRASLGPQSLPAPPCGDNLGKPWKKHGNRNKKEKLRRITKHLEA